MTGPTFTAAWRTVAELAPERTAIVCGERRLEYGEFLERAQRLAGVLHDRGVGAGDKVAIELVNSPEYLITFFAAGLIGAVPVNVNYRYVGAELAYLLDNSDAAALVFHDEFAATVAGAIASLVPDRRPRRLLSVRHDGDGATVDGAVDFDAALDARAPHAPRRAPDPDDLIFLYTGGTTGAPKAVMWRNEDLYVALWQMSRPGTFPPDPAETIRRGKAAATLLPACPLMHGTGLFITLTTLAGGGKVVLIDTPRLDAERTWREIARERVAVLTIVGDAFAQPLLDALDALGARGDDVDLSSLRAITSSGVTWSPENKAGLLRRLPAITLIDSLGASEGIMTRNESTATSAIAPARFALSDRIVVVADDGTRVEPGDGQVGLLGVGGPIPLGYYKDAAKTAATFRTVAGQRYSIPGDYATVELDGTIRLLGRGSACINTGGEKVYPEEVELALRAHPDVVDAVVVGVPDARWGEMVVALVEPRAGATIDQDALRGHCRTALAGYKVPKAFVACPTLERSPSGKADYARLRTVAAEAMEVTR